MSGKGAPREPLLLQLLLLLRLRGRGRQSPQGGALVRSARRVVRGVAARLSLASPRAAVGAAARLRPRPRSWNHLRLRLGRTWPRRPRYSHSRSLVPLLARFVIVVARRHFVRPLHLAVAAVHGVGNLQHRHRRRLCRLWRRVVVPME
eukprot:scaffold17544_cov63-Phaeocystis_antarctica.AAC.3